MGRFTRRLLFGCCAAAGIKIEASDKPKTREIHRLVNTDYGFRIDKYALIECKRYEEAR